jgi:DNA-binding NarL/FixJ family response regulator
MLQVCAIFQVIVSVALLALILMHSGPSAPEDIDRARRVGAKGYVTKDAIAARLVEAILAAARG